MTRSSITIAAAAILGLGAGLYARSHHAEDLVDRVQGVRIASRIPCDGSTNPEEELTLETTFSPGGWRRAFHLDVFESRYCKYVDVHFFCVIPGHERWKHEWAQESGGKTGPGRFWVKSCSAWGAKDAQTYILSGWYQEGGAGGKVPWKQATVKQVSAAPEIYEFTDANGGSARVEIDRK
ncbi:MAG TPA: hypothetical protein VMG35_28625 [Bryobacteraceae bacterium]|nr:hypothetical protein [Bryobacteraceae bacterium]